MKLIVRKVHKGEVVATKIICYTLGIRIFLLTSCNLLVIRKHHKNSV